MGYATDCVRQRWDAYERDSETGLDFAQARYYASIQGRFTSVDPHNIAQEVMATASANASEASEELAVYLSMPQQWNRYAFAVNNPLKYTDPTGREIELIGNEDERAKALLALKSAVGREAGRYLEQEARYDQKTKKLIGYFVKIKDAPDGKSKPFEKINDLAGEFASVIRNSKVVGLRVVPPGGSIAADGRPFPQIVKMGFPDEGGNAGVTGMVGGRLMIHIVDAEKRKYYVGEIPGWANEGGKSWTAHIGEVVAHEIGHAKARMTGASDRDALAHRLETMARRLSDPQAPARIRERRPR
jgi:RHS repeat-associated protein